MQLTPVFFWTQGPILRNATKQSNQSIKLSDFRSCGLENACYN